jgi:hypothetical protein
MESCRCFRHVLGLVLCLGALCSTAVQAAQRVVLIEEFTGTWCPNCPYSGAALSQLEDNFPTNTAFYQIHLGSDLYKIPWGTPRFASYPNYQGLPDVRFDGIIQHYGATPSVYNEYLPIFQTRAAVPSEVQIRYGAEPVSGPTYHFVAHIKLESGGTPRTVRFYMVRLLDHYPASGSYWRNCLMEAATTQDIALTPGQTVIVERTMTFDTVSWSHQSDLKMLCWVQSPEDSGAREVFQSAKIAWPFPPPPALWAHGDMNCDAQVSFSDINPFVLALSSPAAYATQYPQCDILNGDINGDGLVGFADINPFVALLAGQQQVDPRQVLQLLLRSVAAAE